MVEAPVTTAGVRAKVRMYRHGLGDCLLVSLPRKDGSQYHVLIDCGVILGTTGAPEVMTRVLANVREATGGNVDLLIATHEHWDHLSGFIQAADEFAKLGVAQVWLAWTEDPSDTLAQKLTAERAAAISALRLTADHLHLAGDDVNAQAVSSLLGFFGAAAGRSTSDALQAVRAKAPSLRYCRPQDAPIELGDPSVRLYVLGPPHDEALLKRTLPSKAHPETYGLALNAFGEALENLVSAMGADGPEPPFGPLYAIPTDVGREMDFFRRHYWVADPWRRIDSAWLDSGTDLALQLDSATNNTCLVLAIELEDGDVLLFAADAQVGNWLSWQDLSWSVGTRTVTGPDLLRRTILYKVGHHGSHNATLREKGLEMMEGLELALIPVNQQMAHKKGWDRMPLQALVDALKAKTKGAVLQADLDAPAGLGFSLVADPLFFEVSV